MLHLIKVVLFTILVVKVRENHAQAFGGYIKMIPNVTEQVIKAGSELTLTCKVRYPSVENRITWQLPDYILKYPEVSNKILTFFTFFLQSLHFLVLILLRLFRKLSYEITLINS